MEKEGYTKITGEGARPSNLNEDLVFPTSKATISSDRYGMVRVELIS